jgi:hypothetical protein
MKIGATAKLNVTRQISLGDEGRDDRPVVAAFVRADEQGILPVEISRSRRPPYLHLRQVLWRSPTHEGEKRPLIDSGKRFVSPLFRVRGVDGMSGCVDKDCPQRN